MSARECPECEGCGHVAHPCELDGANPIVCPWCDGTGKVHPSVEGEIVVEMVAIPVTAGRDQWCLQGAPVVLGPGRYKVIVQKVGE